MAKKANIFVFSPVITDTLTTSRHEALSKKIKAGDGTHKNIVACLFSVHNIIFSLHERVNKYV